MVSDRRCTVNNVDNGEMIWYEAAMVSTFRGVFDDCQDNHDVEDKLRKAGVIKAKNQTDTESCALVVNFSSMKSAEKFEERLEAYIIENTPEKVV